MRDAEGQHHSQEVSGRIDMPQEFMEVFSPVKNIPHYIRAFPGQYGPNGTPIFYHYAAWFTRAGYSKKGSFVPCTCFNEQRRSVNCALHKYVEQEEQEKKERKTFISLRRAMNIVDLRWWHRNVKKTSQRGKDYTVTMEHIVPKSACEGCQQGFEPELGLRRYWDLSKQDYRQLMSGIYSSINPWCLNCGQRSLTNPAWKCPSCDSVIETRQFEDKVKPLLPVGIVKCMRCQNDVVMRAIWDCGNCGQPKPASIFDGTTTITLQGLSKQERFLTINGFVLESPPKNVPPEMMVPYNFEEFLHNLSSAQISSWMHIADPFALEQSFKGAQPGTPAGNAPYSPPSDTGSVPYNQGKV